MPRLHDIGSVLVIGSGPIVIGQGCEFDYSGTQAIRSLKEEGLRVVLVNSNPATIMTDPELSDATYIEPITMETCASILEKETCDAILPTLGGQTALNVAVQLAESGILKKYNIRLIGVTLEAIRRAEDRRQFKALVDAAGHETPRSAVASTIDEALAIIDILELPVIVRPSYTLGGSGSGMARNRDDFIEIVRNGLQKSPVREVLLEESVEGWKEFELEVMRDRDANHVVVCSIENLDPMGTHTGDSITVAPVQTLRDRDYQMMRDAAFGIMDLVDICGGSNVQFAQDPQTGRMVVIEMNPRVSRSSALASKATGYPIAKIAAKLALGYTLKEIPNDIVGKIPAAFEPAIDYCVVKIPRWNFEKFKNANEALSSQMKSIGEVMALGRTFNEALQKALRSLEAGWKGLTGERYSPECISTANPERLFAIKAAFAAGATLEEVYALTKIDPWFLENIKSIALFEERLRKTPFPCDPKFLREAKRAGFGDAQLADLWGVEEEQILRFRKRSGIEPTVKMVDTCAGEFEAETPYYYVSYEDACEARSSKKRKVVILGSGPNRIGQGIEFDYCCVQAVTALRELDIETIMINCNPETVSTDFDVSDRLYFEPVSYEHVLAVIEKENPEGVIFQFGGQTPLKLLHRLYKQGITVLGTSVDAVDIAEDRKRCNELLRNLDIQQPASEFALDRDEALEKARSLGYPILLRPPYVLGGMAMELVFDEKDIEASLDNALRSSDGRPLMLDKFVEGAVEVDVDAVSDDVHVVIAGVLEHIEEAGIHSGDSSCVIPPISLEDETIVAIEDATEKIAKALGIVGLMNVQYAVKDDTVYCLEINPRASRTVPFVSKATGVPWVKIAARAILGRRIPRALMHRSDLDFFVVKAPVLPFDRFPEVDSLLGPEMRATGEVMGLGASFSEAFIKAQIGAGFQIPEAGHVFISVANRHKRQAIFPAKALHDLGYTIVATSGTAKVLRSHGVPVRVVPKLSAGDEKIVEMIESGSIQLVVNTPAGKNAIEDEKAIRLAANRMKIPSITTLAGFHALVFGIASLRRGNMDVSPLQAYAEKLKNNYCQTCT
ncbi:MAG: carbamoyl-phosphate synthase large subunit [Candidatus Latescibacteria bacterium]|nr:carbamoyl-phosphate synthase large subunit [Candidatus Latescibacterota bacterium]NIM22040.1 carbamoyl-phosphate synthase large subunit [Candidatus Latescibacterota bacterium]NIM66058.1 carbamoyl-phosphate synthase large subunit [Candidatus Latescibacterota bacterium]NIO02466.1 carbamoyl-phosphate synthase large subunit [Candidatus Latescibacterota bacterium]NIO29377.1 carbamoyl-phosphate synthase large subunit [Candidatus Latescibacterota bacterium]